MQKKKSKPFSIRYLAVRHDNIFWPGIDDGMYRISDESLDPIILNYKAKIDAFVSVAGRRHHQHIVNFFKRYKSLQEFDAGLVFPNQLVVADDIHIQKSIVTVGQKFLLSGASGTRMAVRVSQKSVEKKRETFNDITKSFGEKRQNNDLDLPVFTKNFRDLDLVIVAKNFFNFYHFTLETLPYLTLYRKYNLSGRIIIHAPTDSRAGFVREQISKFFPEIADRVIFHVGELKVDRALIVLDARFLYYQSSNKRISSIGNIAKESWQWKDRVFQINSLSTLAMNSCSSCLLDLRNKVIREQLSMSKGVGVPPKRRRLYVARKPNSRARPVRKEAELLAVLNDLGFEIVYFEDYDALEQARMVYEAEVIISVHGAGLSNMLYAQENCLVIELSTLQIAMLRFGDFNPFAIASKARYLHFFADHDWDDQETIPKFSDDGMVGIKLDIPGIYMMRAIILNHLEPDVLPPLVQHGKMLNSEGRKEELEDHCLKHSDRLAHLSEYYVWMANCSGGVKDYRSSLRFLMQATKLNPFGHMLRERALWLAKNLKDDQSFDDLAFGYFHHAQYRATAFFTQNGWDIPEYYLS